VERFRPDLAARVLPSRLDEIAYVNALRQAFDFHEPNGGACYNGAELRHFRPRLEQGRPDHLRQQELAGAYCVSYRRLAPAERTEAVTRYLEAGFGLTDLYCQRFFTIAAEAAQQRHFQRNSFSALDALVGAVLGFANAGQTASSIVNAGFEGIDSTYQNIDNAFLVAPDLANVRDLVHAAQEDFRTRAYASLPNSYESARAVIERYAGHCSFTGMRQLVNDSVTTATRELTPPEPAAPNPQPGGAPGAPPANAKPQAPTSPPNDAAVPVPVSPDTN
jgi:hypothetical protein